MPHPTTRSDNRISSSDQRNDLVICPGLLGQVKVPLREDPELRLNLLLLRVTCIICQETLISKTRHCGSNFGTASSRIVRNFIADQLGLGWVNGLHQFVIDGIEIWISHICEEVAMSSSAHDVNHAR